MMADEVTERGENAEVIAMAETMRTTQMEEIEVMQTVREELTGEPDPTPMRACSCSSWWLLFRPRQPEAPQTAREGGTLKLLSNGRLTAEFDTDCDATRQILTRVGDKWSVLTVVLLGESA